MTNIFYSLKIVYEIFEGFALDQRVIIGYETKYKKNMTFHIYL